MANTKLLFYNSERLNDNVALECHSNVHNEIYINIQNGDEFQYMCLDRETAIKLSKTLRTEISKLTPQ